MASDPISESLYTAGNGDLIDVAGYTLLEVEEINMLMVALVRLREAEQVLSEASRRYMHLSSQDMRALHYLMAAKRQGFTVTPGMLASHLQISPASTTKLLNRLEQGNHIIRHVHPTDRRAFAIEVTPETDVAARNSVGRMQSRRFYAAARLTSEERGIVTRFLQDMTSELDLSDVDWARHHADNGQ